MDKQYRVEICIGPEARRTSRENISDLIGGRMRLAGIRGEIICGSRESAFDYAVENLDEIKATGLSKGINGLEGYAAKVVEWKR
jgi:hypothetical protein